MNNYDDKNNNSSTPIRPRFNFLYVLIAVVLFVVLYFIIINVTRTPATRYTEADISSTDGELYSILNDRDVIELSYEGHPAANYFRITGRYSKNGNRNDSSAIVTFYADINFDNKAAVDNYTSIINTRTFTITKNGTITTGKYYSKASSDARICNFTTADYTTRVSFWDYLPTILIWVIVIGLGFFLINRLFKSIGSAGGVNSQFNFNSSRARRETKSKVRFKDVAGCDEVKAELTEMVDYFKNASKYTKLGAKLPKGILLQGPPGTGKTLLAKAVAGEAGVPFYSISGSDFVEMYVGVGAGRVRDMFKIAKQNSPCLIFIDEIDAVGRQRGAGLGGGNDEREQTLNQLLVEMDGFADNSGVIVMAATNRADVLDPALLRAGRFDRTITVDLPDREGRAAILKVHSRNKIIAKDIDFDAIASRTVGFSGADLANIMNDAAILAVREKKEAIDMDDIDEAIDRQIAGPAKSNKGLSPDEKTRVAWHEAGHATIGIRLQHSQKVQRITIIPRGRTGGHVLMTPESDRFLLTKSDLEAEITGLLGGRTSEEIKFGDVSTGASNDIERATNIAREMVVEYGMSDLGPIQYEKNSGSVFLGRDYTSSQVRYSSEIALQIDKAVRKIIDECHEKARQILTEYYADLELIATTLEEKETITAEQIDYLIEHRELPKKEVKKELSDSNQDNKTEELANSGVRAVEVKKENKVEGIQNSENKIPLVDDEQTEAFIKSLDIIRLNASCLCLFVEDEGGIELTLKGLDRITKETQNKMVLGAAKEGQVEVKPIANLSVEKKLWSKFAHTSEEFGNYCEEKSEVEVTLIKVDPKSFAKLQQGLARRSASRATIGEASPKAKSTAKSLKDLANKDKDDKK